MKKIAFLATVATSILLATSAAAFQTKTTKGQTTSPTKGTVQMPGDNGKLLTTYQLGAKGSELHFTLESAAFATRFPTPEDMLVAGANERLLVLTFTVQNPLNQEMKLGSSSFQFSEVSPEDENFEFRGYLLNALTKKHMDQSLKPAQKVKCSVVIPIHAAGVVPKLIVQRGSGKVLRYDLTGKVGKTTCIFAENGLDFKDETQALGLNTPADAGFFEFSLRDMAFTTEAIKGYKPSPGEKYLVVTAAFKNMMLKPAQIGFQYFTPTLAEGSGKVISWNRDLLSETSDDSLYQDIAPGYTVLGRYYFRVPENVGQLSLKLTHVPSNRTVNYNVAPRVK
ncbi:MAG: hypothetical protein K8R88_15655 [Armatimonadetes bacterium]|nr:hypothetical protein [Armatimonadota bacterium]